MRLSGFSILLPVLLASGFTNTPAFCEDATASGAASEASTDGGGGGGAPSSTSKDFGAGLWKEDPSAWKIAIYPVYGWLPVLGASFNVPDLPNIPNAPGGGSTGGDVSGTFNGAGFAGVEIEKSRVIARASFLYAAISGDKANPPLHLGMHFLFGEGFGGYKITKDLSLEGGVRRISLSINANLADRPGIKGKPGITDPLIAMSWKHVASRKWLLSAHVDGGGFGVGSDVDISATGRADYRFTKHFGVTMGVGALHLQTSNTLFDNTRIARTVKLKQTLWGPLFGIGLYF